MKSLKITALFAGVALGWMVFSVQAQEGGSQYLSAEEAQVKYHEHPREVHWHHDGITGQWDKAQLQRGLQIYKEVCSACHSLSLVAFRDLEDLGYSSGQVKAFAAEYTLMDGPDDFGEMFERAGKPSDHFPGPFANDQAAKAANGGALPPDLSLITKARHEGPDYVFSLVSGYEDAPSDVELADGQNYNPYFHSLILAMAPPLNEGQVEYADGTKATVEQMAEDVAAFLTWTAEPKLVERKETGLMVMLFLGLLIVVTYISYRRTWAKLKR